MRRWNKYCQSRSNLVLCLGLCCCPRSHTVNAGWHAPVMQLNCLQGGEGRERWQMASALQILTAAHKCYQGELQDFIFAEAADSLSIKWKQIDDNWVNEWCYTYSQFSTNLYCFLVSYLPALVSRILVASTRTMFTNRTKLSWNRRKKVGMNINVILTGTVHQNVTAC